MNKFQELDKLIEAAVRVKENNIIEISSMDELYEMTGMTGTGVAGHAQKEDQNEMISEKELTVENKLRNHIRKRIKNILHEQNLKQQREEESLRKVIRALLKEGDISDIHPHRSTGINMLEDVLKKAIPTLRMDFKRLTTDKKQRDSFRAHIINAVKDALAPMAANDAYLQGQEGGSGGSSTLLSEPTGGGEPAIEPEPEAVETEEPDFAALEEADIEVTGMEDEEKKIPVEDDDKPSEEEDFGSGLEDYDETGRNMAFTSFKKVSQYILDAYDSLADPKDKDVFTDYLITNLKLYFDKFEDELATTVDEPTTPEYDQTKEA